MLHRVLIIALFCLCCAASCASRGKQEANPPVGSRRQEPSLDESPNALYSD